MIRTRYRSRGSWGSRVDRSAQTLVLFGDSIIASASTNSKDNGSSYTVSAITRGAVTIVTEGTSGWSPATGDTTYLWGIGGTTELNNTTQVLTAGTATTGTFAVNSTGYGAYTSNGKFYPLNNAVISNLAQGIVPYINSMMGQRFTFNHQLNRGIGGNSSSDCDTRKARDLAGVGATAVIIHVGTNDITAGTSAATVWANIQSIVTYVTGTLNAYAIVCTVPPRDSDTSGQKDAREALNALIMAHSASKYIPVNTYAAVVDGSRNWTTGYAYDGVHPNPLGGWYMAKAIYNALVPRFGFGGGFILRAGNLLLNPTMSGTSGTISGTAITNTATATSWIGESAGGTVATTRTLSKDGNDKQRMIVNYGSGLSTAERLSIRQPVTTGLSVGTYYVCEAEITLESDSGAGIWYEASLELRNQSSGFAFDHARRNNEPLAVADIITFNDSRKLLLRTQPLMYITGWTELRPRINLTCKCDTGAKAAEMVVHNAQLYAV